MARGTDDSGFALPEDVASIRRPSLHEETVTVVRNLILEGKIEPGTRIAEALLCQRLGISRTPLREALKVLASEELVELLPNRGAVVARIGADDTAELFDVLEALETKAAALAAERAGEADFNLMQSLHAQMLEHHAAGRRATYYEANQRVHRLLIECARNRALASTHLMISRKIARARYAVTFTQSGWDESVAEHQRIADAFLRRDTATLDDAVREHTRRTAARVLAVLRESETAAESRREA